MTDAVGGGRRLTITLLLVLVGAALLLFYTDVFGYSSMAGYAALLAIPFSLGGMFTQMVDPKGESSPIGCFVMPTLAIAGVSLLLWLLIGEGAVCIAMILPLWIPAATGGALANRLSNRRERQTDADLLKSSWLIVPLMLLFYEQVNPQQWQDEAVVREITIAVPAAELWPMLGSIRAIRPDEGRSTFTQDVLGIPRPSDAVLVHRDGESVRLARWGNSIHFEEHIVAMVPGSSMQWAFVFGDGSVSQHTDRHISPDGPVLKIAQGGYEITEIAPGISKLRLTTKYRMRSRMAPYLRLWGEVLLGDVEANVLAIIKQRAEARS